MPTLNKSAESREDRGRSPKEKGSPKNGWARYHEKQEEAEEEKEKRDNEARDFWLLAGESAVIQILDPEPYIFDGHSIKDKNGKFIFEPCQLSAQKHCLMCTDGIKRGWRPALRVLDFRGNWDKDKKKFKHDEPVEKIWVPNQTTMGLLEQKMRKKKREVLTDLVVEITRTGTGKKNTAYAFEDAFDEDEERIPPVKWKSKLPPTNEIKAPKDDDDLVKLGFEAGND